MKQLIVLQTDFTFKEGAVAVMKGVIKCIDRDLEIIDLTHEIPQYDTYSASFRLRQVLPFYPTGTIFVSVVDPAVGSSRKACIAKTKSGHYIVTPDNLSLTHVDRYLGLLEVREIDKKWRYQSDYSSEVFHGRDVFAYVGALLASGQVAYEEFGKTYSDYQVLSYPFAQASSSKLSGILEIIDPNFGNVWTNIPTSYLDKLDLKHGDQIKVTITHGNKVVVSQILSAGSSFSTVPLNSPVLYFNELGYLALALNQNDYRAQFKVHFGPSWIITLEKNI
ncbi:MAG: SAM-dependent chlorinase/fluorinase [Erysipelotrichaceae bacterium]|nr:SAM-dependent chlorinase/fluorinase [Erysipelotrichaceae bacterium]